MSNVFIKKNKVLYYISPTQQPQKQNKPLVMKKKGTRHGE
jgi:hypothetical protein